MRLRLGIQGKLVGTILPQLAASVARPGSNLADALVSAGAAAITGLVVLGFVHGTPRGRLLVTAASAGRWLMVAGIGGWVGYLLFARLILLLDRLGFLVGDWLGLGR